VTTRSLSPAVTSRHSPDRVDIMGFGEQDRYRGCILGLAVGDAVGTVVEFQPRGTFEPITDMVGGGPFRLCPGQWTDDTSMALCLAASLVECGRFDPLDQMGRYLRWMDRGYMSSTGSCFDIGNTTRRALESFKRTGDPFSGPREPNSAGNGSIMRLAPVPMYCHPDRTAALELAAESSRTTHGTPECLDACRVLSAVLWSALSGHSKEAVLGAATDLELESEGVRQIAMRTYRRKAQDEISGTGYVVASLEAALWCFDQTSSFRDAVLSATNLGDDADTTAAVCGQVAGAFYGASGIPEPWLEKLANARRDRCPRRCLGGNATRLGLPSRG